MVILKCPGNQMFFPLLQSRNSELSFRDLYHVQISNPVNGAKADLHHPTKAKTNKKVPLEKCWFQNFMFFFGELFEKNNGFPHEFFAPFFWVNLPSKLKPNKKLPVCQAVDHCESCNPGYYVSGTSCKAFFFWLVGVPKFDIFTLEKLPKPKKERKQCSNVFHFC